MIISHQRLIKKNNVNLILFISIFFLYFPLKTWASNVPQLFIDGADWQTNSWTFTSATTAQTTPVFNSTTNQLMQLHLVNVPAGAKLSFDWSVTTGITNDSVTILKNGTGSSLATLTNGVVNNVLINLDMGSYYLEFKYTRSSTNGGLSQAILSNVVLNLNPDIVSNSLEVIPKDNKITINWVTDEDAKSRVLYGTTQTLGQSTNLTGSFVTIQTVTVNNWPANTAMFYRLENTDAQNQVSTSALYRSYSIPNINIAVGVPGCLNMTWISNPGEWLLYKTVTLTKPNFTILMPGGCGGVASQSAALAAPGGPPSDINTTSESSSGPEGYFRLQRADNPAYILIGP